MPRYSKEDCKLVYSSEESAVNRCPVCGAEPSYEPFQLIGNILCYPWRCKCGALGYERSDVIFRAQCVEVGTLPPDLRGKYVTLKTRCINGPLGVGDLVLSTIDDHDFPCLPGKVTAIELLGSKLHDIGNLTDDVHVDFTEDYGEQRKREITEAYAATSGNPALFDNVRLDEIIMDPACLINITGISEEDLALITNSEDYAVRYAYRVVRGIVDDYENVA